MGCYYEKRKFWLASFMLMEFCACHITYRNYQWQKSCQLYDRYVVKPAAFYFVTYSQWPYMTSTLSLISCIKKTKVNVPLSFNICLKFTHYSIRIGIQTECSLLSEKWHFMRAEATSMLCCIPNSNHSKHLLNDDFYHHLPSQKLIACTSSKSMTSNRSHVMIFCYFEPLHYSMVGWNLGKYSH